MIDTIRFAISLSNKDALTAKKYTRFVSSQTGFAVYNFNTYKMLGLNKISLENRVGKSCLVVECSIPILLYGNNIAEIGDDNVIEFCNHICQIINTQLEMSFSTVDILTADVRRIHYSKNIIMPDAKSILEVIDYASKTDISLNRSISSVKYQNGNSFHVRTSTYDITIYDKTSENRNKKITSQHPLSKTSNIVRIEIRLNDKRAISRFYPTEIYTVESLLKTDIARHVVLAGFDMIYSPKHYGGSPLNAIKMGKGRAKSPNELLAGIGLNFLLRKYGTAATKNLLKSCFDVHVWYRYKKLAVNDIPPASIELLLSELEKWETIPP